MGFPNLFILAEIQFSGLLLSSIIEKKLAVSVGKVSRATHALIVIGNFNGVGSEPSMYVE